MLFPSKGSVVISLLLIVIALVRCSGPADKASVTITTKSVSAEDDIIAGQKLAATYCQSCHQLPHPSLLDKTTWRNSVVPVMGLYLGLNYHVSDSILNYIGDMSRFPKTAVIDTTQLQQIMAYYTAKAPEHLPVPDRPKPIHQLPFFKILPTPAEWVTSPAMASCVKIDDSVTPHRLLVFDATKNRFIVLTDKVKTVNSSALSGSVVDMTFHNGNIVTTTIGSDLYSNDIVNGDIKEISIDKSGKVALQERLLVDRIGRPISTSMADINGDGKLDYLVTRFGKMTGSLSWYEDDGQRLKQHIIRDRADGIRSIIDTDNPKKIANIWTLFSQGDESLYHYTNDGKGNFKEQRVLTFPPAYGSMYFDFFDFNGDGFKDLLYVSGDNGDYSQLPKPYHGIYIYLNDGKDNFKQKYFYPINGCYKAIAKDFDGDGDLDIATISEFPAKEKPWEAFMYFENKGGLNFQAYTLPLNVPFSNGMTIDAGDIDGDGKPDLLLGNGFVAPNFNHGSKQPLFIVLKNISTAKHKVAK
jgi:mono/diheme cytochrome c family protein